VEAQTSIHGVPQKIESGKAEKARLQENGSSGSFQELGWAQYITPQLLFFNLPWDKVEFQHLLEGVASTMDFQN
jgi:hypothetical protein